MLADAAPGPGPATTEEELTSRLTTAISRISRRIRVRSFNMTYGALSALATIDRSGPLRPADLAAAERVTRPTITRIVAELESHGFITRTDDPDDGRAFLVSVTAAGIIALKKARAERAKDVTDLMEGLTEAEIDTVHHALPALEKIALHVSTGADRR
ncbi:MarR family winged helix-turn-helix transcriptional regulator [Acidipropionibacterium virtanenii]|uniref:Putative HTH-type transcriptional regulator n=1 Tax=Acidipropionibacterium virtanenii TaxID=2057246 RepID=A0A344USC6_9ACTN|nr:MarR family transcriptional regulator [Acidipropionibacterium virtanenii]AXE38174.1 putative HTH-type transcriptional regulator [Acidipropionibacterium virtanenii]